MLMGILIALASLLGSAVADVYVTDRSYQSTIADYRTTAATFGRPFPDGGISGRAVKADPADGCTSIAPPPEVDFVEVSLSELLSTGRIISDTSMTRWVVMIKRYGGCNFEAKVRNAMKANYSAVIVYNVNSNKLVPMAGSDDNLIPSVFMGYDDAQVLLQKYTYPRSPELRIVVTDDHPFDINAYLLPFAIVVGICFIVMLAIVVCKCLQDYRRARRHRLPRSALRKLPIHKFKNGDPFETCCICLDDFEEGDKLRILPCDHGYHAKCIDPWLVKTKRICPQCRKRVFESNERGAGLISETDGRTDSDSDLGSPRPSTSRRPEPPPQHDEREPLLASRRTHTSRFNQRERRNVRRHRRSGQPVRNNGTFTGPTPPPQQGAERPPGSSAWRVTQERIRQALGRANRDSGAIFQQLDIVSSEEFNSSSSSDEGEETRVESGQSDAVAVRIEQPPQSQRGRSHQFMAEVHSAPAPASEEAGVSHQTPTVRMSDSEVVVIHSSDEEQPSTSARALASTDRQGREATSSQNSQNDVENV